MIANLVLSKMMIFTSADQSTLIDLKDALSIFLIGSTYLEGGKFSEPKI